MHLRAAIFLVLAATGLYGTTPATADDSDPAFASLWSKGSDSSTLAPPSPPTTVASIAPVPQADAGPDLSLGALNPPAPLVSSDPDVPEGQLSLRPADQIGPDQPTLKLPAFADDGDDLWARLRSGFALADLDTPLIKEHENWYANRPEYVRRMVERSQRYLFHIVEEVEKRGMPTEIALLPMIESAYNPKAYSTSHASGIWQFVPATGKNFGLSQNWLYDGRRDIIAATDAALDYLQKLYDMFGSWELALAAYNWGEGSVARAIAKNQARGEPTDFLSLHLPPETRNYLPKLLAVKNIVMDPAAYGLELSPIPNSPYFAKVKVKQQMDVAVAARLAEMPLDEFVALNPAYNKPLVAGTGKPTLLLPVNKVNSFSLNLQNYDSPLSSWQTYTPRRGEKLGAIAERFGISLARLKDINGISGRKKKFTTAQTLLVPITKSGHTPTLAAQVPDNIPVADQPAQARNASHTVAKGETLLTIAKHYGVSVAELKSQNHLKSSRLTRGQKLSVAIADKPLRVAEPAHAKQAAAKMTAAHRTKAVVLAKASARKPRAHYVVKRGDTVFSIARRFKVAVDDLKSWNNLSPALNLQPGNKLTVSPPQG